MKSQDIFLLLQLLSLSKKAVHMKEPAKTRGEPYRGETKLWRPEREIADTGTMWEEDADKDPERFHAFIEEAQIIHCAEDLSLKLLDDSTLAFSQSEEDMYSVRSLALLTGISKSEVSNAINRCYQSGLAKPSRQTSRPSVNTKALLEFIIYGIRYTFPVKMQELTRGTTTGLTAPIFNGELMSTSAAPPVWPDSKGDTSGFSVQPLFKTVPMAARQDPNLYALLALVDSIRLGQPRERNVAISMLKELI